MIPLTPEGDSHIPLEYLSSSALPKLQDHLDISKEEGLEILVKSLLFENYDDFNNNLTQEGFEKYVPGGYFFSEFVLTRELKIDFREALRLKSKLDKFHFYDSGISSGNIVYADLRTINEYSFKIVNGNVHRIMFDYPISFYCRELTQTFHFSNEYRLKDYDCLWCDGFSFAYPEYFDGVDHQIHYFKAILEALLLADDLIISFPVIDKWKKKNLLLYDSIFENFDNYLVYSDYPDSNSHYGYFFPMIGSDEKSRIDRRIIHANSPYNKRAAKWTVGSKLCFYKEQFNLNQKELSEKSGITDRTIRKMEKDQGIRDIYTIEKICRAFSISLSEFFHGIE